MHVLVVSAVFVLTGHKSAAYGPWPLGLRRVQTINVSSPNSDGVVMVRSSFVGTLLWAARSLGCVAATSHVDPHFQPLG